MATKTITHVTLNLFGESRRVEIYYHPDMTDYSGNTYCTTAHLTEGYKTFVARLGRGTKMHPVGLTFSPIDPKYGLGRGNRKVIAEDGTEWQFYLSCTILNRAGGVICGWADVIAATSQHSGGRY